MRAIVNCRLKTKVIGGWVDLGVEAGFLWRRAAMDENRGDALGSGRVPFHNNSCFVKS